MLCHQPLCQTRPDCLRLFEQPPWHCTLGSYVWRLWPVLFLFFSGFPLVLSSPHPPTHRFLDAPSSTRPALTGSSTPAPPTAKLPAPQHSPPPAPPTAKLPAPHRTPHLPPRQPSCRHLTAPPTCPPDCQAADTSVLQAVRAAGRLPCQHPLWHGHHRREPQPAQLQEE